MIPESRRKGVIVSKEITIVVRLACVISNSEGVLYKRGKVLPSFSLFPSCPLCPELSSLRWRSKGCGDGLGYTCTCTHMYTCVYRIRTNWWRLLTGWLSVLPFLFFFFCPTVKRSRTRENNTTPEGYQP